MAHDVFISYSSKDKAAADAAFAPAERDGIVPDEFYATSNFETDVRIELKRVLGLLEPAIILGMGVLVAFIVVAMLLAIFSINEIPL